MSIHDATPDPPEKLDEVCLISTIHAARSRSHAGYRSSDVSRPSAHGLGITRSGDKLCVSRSTTRLAMTLAELGYLEQHRSRRCPLGLQVMISESPAMSALGISSGQPVAEKVLDGRAICALVAGILISRRDTYVAHLAQNKVPERERQEVIGRVRLLSEFLRAASSAAHQYPRNAHGC
jgi:hypothetical protein